MLLLYRGADPVQVPENRIYIPLCFYFIDGLVDLGDGITLFTFHYASTLSYGNTGPRRYEELFTFHYASTLSKSSLQVNNLRSQIYIPLCFYFIDGGESTYEEIITNLHSTMLLLYPR